MTSPSDSSFFKKRALVLYAIIVIKLFKGLFFVSAAITVYALSDNDLPDLFKQALVYLHLQPGNQFFQAVAAKLATVSEHDARVFALGTLLYSMFAFVEAFGLMLRISWAGYMAIGESLFFIPIEINSLLKTFNWSVFGVLILNVGIAWYLIQNRHRLFRHHLHLPHRKREDDSKGVKIADEA